MRDLELDEKRSAKEVQRIFIKHIGPVIGDKLVATVTTDDVLDVVTPIVRRGSPVHADNVRAYLRAALGQLLTRRIANWDIARTMNASSTNWTVVTPATDPSRPVHLIQY
ncbi:MAG: hypothetical protein VCE75_03615 [Alphaproteobacteria bacterium]